MAQQAIGMIETRGLVALVEATDAMLKAANVELIGPMVQVGNALVTATVVGDVAAVKAATDEFDVRRLEHRVGCFDERDEAAGFNHANCLLGHRVIYDFGFTIYELLKIQMR